MGLFLNRILPVILFLIYIGARYARPEYLFQMGPFAGELFEVALVILTLFVFKNFPRERFFKRALVIPAFITLFVGFAVYRMAIVMHLFIPLDFTAWQTSIFLLVVGPLLEEFLYRYTFWEWFHRLGGVKAALIGSTLLFSFGHFYSWFLVPGEFSGFIIYQSSYTLLLGAWLAAWRLRSGTLFVPIAFHFLFNLGFYLGGF